MKRPLLIGTLALALAGLAACDRAPVSLTPPSEPPPTTAPESAPDSPTAPTNPSTSNPSGEPNASADTVVIPGERVGQVTATTSRQDLADLYGEAVLEDTDIPMGEGFTDPGTIVNLGPNQQFTVVWLDTSRSQPLMARDFGTAWKTPEGIGVGTSYAELQRVLGEFELYGFAWDYGGTLSLEGTNLDQYYGELLLRVNPSDAAAAEHPAEYEAVMGDRLFASTDPNFGPLDIAVDSMMVYLNDPVD